MQDCTNTYLCHISKIVHVCVCDTCSVVSIYISVKCARWHICVCVCARLYLHVSTWCIQGGSYLLLWYVQDGLYTRLWYVFAYMMCARWYVNESMSCVQDGTSMHVIYVHVIYVHVIYARLYEYASVSYMHLVHTCVCDTCKMVFLYISVSYVQDGLYMCTHMSYMQDCANTYVCHICI